MWLEGEAIMNTVNDTSNLDHHELTDTELDVVTGGAKWEPVSTEEKIVAAVAVAAASLFPRY
jgi:hypothetical protein